jgi:tRNA 2-thiouridine synthesizing protein A
MDKSQADVYLDCRGLSCPMPVLKTKKVLDAMTKGQTLLVETTDQGSKADISAVLKRTSNELLQTEEKDNVYQFLIRKLK